MRDLLDARLSRRASVCLPPDARREPKASLALLRDARRAPKAPFPDLPASRRSQPAAFRSRTANGMSRSDAGSRVQDDGRLIPAAFRSVTAAPPSGKAARRSVKDACGSRQDEGRRARATFVRVRAARRSGRSSGRPQSVRNIRHSGDIPGETAPRERHTGAPRLRRPSPLSRAFRRCGGVAVAVFPTVKPGSPVGGFTGGAARSLRAKSRWTQLPAGGEHACSV
jgi:hypothetical protein